MITIKMNSLLRILINRTLYNTYYSSRKFSSYLTFCCGGVIKSKQRGLLAISNQVTSFPLAAMSGTSSIKTVAYENVKALKDNKNVLLIDVREPSELQKTGVLPGSINIPLGQLENVLKNIPPEEFLSKYGRPKPDINFPVVFSCQSGKRSLMASETAVKLGYKDVSSYGGGYSDWEKKSKQ